MPRSSSPSLCEPLESRRLYSVDVAAAAPISVVQANGSADPAITQGLNPAPQSKNFIDFSLGDSDLIGVSANGGIWRSGQDGYQQLGGAGYLVYFNRNELSLGRELGCSGFQDSNGSPGLSDGPNVFQFSGDSQVCSIVPPRS